MYYGGSGSKHVTACLATARVVHEYILHSQLVKTVQVSYTN